MFTVYTTPNIKDLWLVLLKLVELLSDFKRFPFPSSGKLKSFLNLNSTYLLHAKKCHSIVNYTFKNFT